MWCLLNFLILWISHNYVSSEYRLSFLTIIMNIYVKNIVSSSCYSNFSDLMYLLFPSFLFSFPFCSLIFFSLLLSSLLSSSFLFSFLPLCPLLFSSPLFPSVIFFSLLVSSLHFTILLFSFYFFSFLLLFSPCLKYLSSSSL